MIQKKMRWKKAVLAAVMAVMVGSAGNPMALEAAEIGSRQHIFGTEPTVTETPGTEAGDISGQEPVTEPTDTEVPGDTETPTVPEEVPTEEPAVKAVARVRVDGADTEYTDIQEAWAAVSGRTGEIILLSNITTIADGGADSGTGQSSGFRLLEGDVVLDLGGYQWTYQCGTGGENGPVNFDLIEVNGAASLTVRGSGSSAMTYAGSGEYKGACLYATGDATLNIEGGTFSSNVSAPVYVDGATLNVKGGVFKAAGPSESAITMNNGTFSMTGGEVKVGILKLNNTNGSQDAAIGGNSQLSGIETTGKKALTIGDTLEDGYGYRSTKSKNKAWVSDEKELSKNSINNVATAQETLSKVELSITPTSPDLGTDGISFTYDGTNKTTFTLTATPEMDPSHGGDVTQTTYQWYVNGEPITGATTDSYSFDNATQAGTFTYRVVATLDGGNPVEDSMEVKILPITGTITNKGSGGYPTEYLYGDEIEDPGRGETYFDLSPGGPALEKLTWKYTWYSGDAPAGDDSNKLSGKPSDKGIYTLKIEATDGPNYTATGTVTIEIKEKIVTPEIRCTSTKPYDGTNVVKDAQIILKDQNGQEVTQSGDEVIVSAVPVYENAEAGENKQISINVSDIVLEGAKAGNYVLDAGGQTKLTTVGSITKARLTLQVEIQPLTQSVNKPVTVTVKVLDDDHRLLKANDIRLSVRGSNDPAPTLRDAGNGTFTGTFISTTTGDVSFLAKVDTANYDSNEASGSGLTIIREVVRTTLNLTATRTEITEGDEVTYTATVTKVNGSAGEPLSGGVQFYIDGEAGSNQVGTSQQIGASGDQASVTMNGSVLTVGDHTITAVFTSDTAEGSRGSVNTKVQAKPVETVKSAITLTANESEVTYGDEVTYTATVTKVNGRDGEAFAGGVQFYIDGTESTNRIGSAQSIRVSGDKVSIKLGKSELQAGDHKVTAVFASDSAEGSSAEVSTKVEQIKLTWDVSNLRASKTAGTSGEVNVFGTLDVEGILDGEIKFVQPDSAMKTNGFKATEAGTYKVTVTLEDGEWTFDPKEPKNYALPEGDPEIKATVNALKELSDPPEAKDGNTYKLVMEEGLSQVPGGLKNTSFNTPGKIESELKRILTSTGRYAEEHTAVYDVTLQVSTDEGKTWMEANASNFPKEGVVVTLPYPGGTGRYTHNFAVAHMFGESLFGHTSGTVEVPAVTKTDNGLQFRVTGLSPIAVAWTDGAGGSVSGTSNSPVGSAIRRLTGAQTGDDSPVLLYAGLAGGCILLLLILMIVLIVRGRKKTR